MTNTQHTTPARAEAQDEGAAGEAVAYRQWCQSDKPHQGGWWQLIDKHDGDHAIATGGGKNLRALYAHPSPTPAADADRVRGLIAHEIKQWADTRWPKSSRVGSVMWVSGLTNRILAALKSTAAKEGGEG